LWGLTKIINVKENEFMKKRRFMGLVFGGIALTMGLVSTGCSGDASPSQTAATTKAVADTSETPAAPAAGDQHEPYDLAISAASSGGQVNRWVVAACDILNRYSDFITASAITTTGTAENANLASVGETDIGAVGSYNIYASTAGLQQWEGKPLTNLKYLYCLYPDYLYGVTSAGSDMNTFADMKGHRINLNQVSANGGVMMVLDALGIDSETYYSSYVNLSNSEANTAIAEGSIDGHIETSGKTLTNTQQLQASQAGLKILGLSDDEIKTITDALPYYIPAVMEDAYEGIDPINTVSGATALLVNEGVPDYVCYEIVKILTEHHDELVSVMPQAEYSTPENTLKHCFIDLAPGARQYFEEIGVIK